MVDGSARERELVNLLYDRQFAVMRAPASGSASDHELPDAIAGRDGTVYVFEAKSSAEKPIYVEGVEIRALRKFGRGFDAKVRVAARFNYHEWAFFEPNQLHVTPGGNYRVKKEDIPNGETLEDL